MDTVAQRPVFPAQDAIDALKVFNEPLPGTPSEPAEILRLLHEVGSPATVAQTAGRYFGFVDGGAIPVAVASKWLSDVWDQNAALYVISPVVSRLEEVCENWLTDRHRFGMIYRFGIINKLGLHIDNLKEVYI